MKKLAIVFALMFLMCRFVFAEGSETDNLLKYVDSHNYYAFKSPKKSSYNESIVMTIPVSRPTEIVIAAIIR